MRRILKRAALWAAGAVIAFGGLLTVLAVRTPDPRASDSWRRLADLPRPRGEVTAAVGKRCARLDECARATERMFVIGGLAGVASTVDAVDIYDPIADRWSRGPSLPERRHHPAAAGIAGSVYVSGGSKRTTRWTPERNFWMLAPNAQRWERLPDMPEGRMGHQMAAVAGKLFAIGGRGGRNVLIYDLAARTWSRGAEIPVARDHLGVAVLGTKIYAIGGRDTDLLRRVDIYDTVADRWSDGPPLPVPMSAMAAGATINPDRAIHVVGGEDPATLGGYVIDRHLRLDAGSAEWVADPLPILATHGAAAVVIDGRLYLTGGARRQGALSPLGWTGRTEMFAPDLA